MNVERRLPYWNSFVEFFKMHNLVYGFDFDGILFEPRVAVSKSKFTTGKNKLLDE